MTVSKTLRKGVISFEFDWKREIGTRKWKGSLRDWRTLSERNYDKAGAGR